MINCLDKLTHEKVWLGQLTVSKLPSLLTGTYPKHDPIYLFIYFSHAGPPAAPRNGHSALESAIVDGCEADQHYQGNLLDKCTSVSRSFVPSREEWFLCEVHVVDG